jgi:DNA polymerase elongation subunit (family B)
MTRWTEGELNLLNSCIENGMPVKDTYKHFSNRTWYAFKKKFFEIKASVDKESTVCSPKSNKEPKSSVVTKLKNLIAKVGLPIGDRMKKPSNWVCSFDLETTGIGVVLCGVVKPWGEKPIVFRGDKYKADWKEKRSDDSAVCKAIFDELQKYDIWIAHNGVMFDDKYLRSRLAKVGVTMPSHKLVDPVRLARNFYKFRYNSLEAVGEHFGHYGKTKVAQHIWTEAALDGSVKALDYITNHCIADVVLLEKVANEMKPLIPKINTYGSDR